MGIEKVKDEIIEKAKEQSSLAVSQAKKSAEAVLRDVESRLESQRARSSEEAKGMMIDIKRQEMARAELESKKIFLQAKKEIIDDVFGQAKKSVSGLKEKEIASVISSLLKKAGNDIDIGYIYCNPGDAKFFSQFKVEKAGISGGFIAENREMTVRVDYSFDTLFDSLRESNMEKIAAKLFE